MKNPLSPVLGLVLTLPLFCGGLANPLYAQDEVPEPDANVTPEQNPTSDDVELPPATDALPDEPIPEEIQREADEGAAPGAEASPPMDESGPQVDDTYNSVYDSGESIFSQIYVGPTVQIGFPNPLTYGIEALFARTVSFGFSTGSYKIDQIDKAELDIKGWDLHARWHPWMGSFFVGASYGRMEVDGVYEDKFKARISGFERDVDARIDASIETNYFTPRLGWFAVWDTGLTVGFDLGVQIPLGPDTSLSASFPGASPLEEAQIKATSDYQDLEDQADTAIKVLGKRSIPVVTLLQVGWLF